MLLKAFLPLGLFFLSLSALQAGVSEAQAKAAIASFLADPLSAASRESARQINQFTEETPDHEVVVDANYMPWLQTKNPPEHSDLLLIAFFAGNLQEQMQKGSSKPEPYAGALAVIAVYSKIKAQKSGYRVDSIERWISLDQQGKLKAALEKN